MRKSTDGQVGKEWGPIQVVWGKSPAERQSGLNYPSPVVDLKTGKVHLFFVGGCAACPRGKKCDPCPMWRVTSADSGKTWSSPPDNMTKVSGFQLSVAGGGGGVQLASGRLVFPCAARNSTGGANGSGRTACFSDDGDTWKMGSPVPLADGTGGLGESSLVADGRSPESLAMFIRSGSTHRDALENHAVASSLNGGATWGNATMIPAIVGVTCQGSVGAAGGAKVANGKILMSAPQSRDMGGYGQNGRENLAVFSLELTSGSNVVPAAAAKEVSRVYPCKAGYSSFSEDGKHNPHQILTSSSPHPHLILTSS